MTSLDHTLAALAKPTRHGVIEFLRVQPRRVGDLAFEFGISAPAMSCHLRVLRVTALGGRGTD
jgi:DNA-binding transcriptional ArsR family regulator